MEITDEQSKLLKVFEINNTPLQQARNTLLLNAHFLEKEMTVNQVDVPSQKFMKNVAQATETLLNNNHDFDKFALLTGVKLLSEYDKTKIYPVSSSVPIDLIQESCFINVGRKKQITRCKKNAKAIKFIQSRESHRLFKDELVNEETILKVIDLACCTPTACNRQPCIVLYSTNRDGNNLLRNVVPDKFVCQKIPNFFAIAVNKTYFNKGEEAQCYVNGGIFLSNVLLSLSAYGLGATAFQTPIFAGANPDNIHSLGLSDEYFILATVGFGYPIKKAVVAASHKRNHVYAARKVNE